MLLPNILIAILVFLMDQVSKYFVISNLDIKKSVAVLPFLNLSLTHNNGAAFGLLSTSNGWQRWFFVGIAFVVSAIVLVWSARLTRKDWWETVGLGMILGGAWGNMLDRVRLGRVTDFIDFYLGNWHWYTFNVADIGICVGAALLIIASFKPRELIRHTR